MKSSVCPCLAVAEMAIREAEILLPVELRDVVFPGAQMIANGLAKRGICRGHFRDTESLIGIRFSPSAAP